MEHRSLLASTYSSWLVALSVAIAIAASYSALDMSARTAATRGRLRRLWLTGGAVAMGGGIWSMHYIGMLAFELAVPVLYDLPLVAASLGAAILASAAALFVISRPRMNAATLATGSIAMGAGISAMHYIGMAAMRVTATATWNGWIVALSVAISVVVSLVALGLAFRLRTEGRALAPRKLGSACLMGVAIAAMHYTGMAAATFHASAMHGDAARAVNVTSLGVAGITVVTFLVLALAMITSIMDRRFTDQSVAHLAGAERHRNLIERSLAGVYWSSTDARIIDCNEACARILGYASRDALLQGNARDLYVDAATRDRFLADLREQRRLPDFESQLTRLDGQPVWVLENAILLDQKDGTQLIEGTMIDITARKLVEDELRASDTRLRAEIVERQRVEVALQLKQRLESVGQLAAGIAHEINTPVQFVSDSVHFLRESLSDLAALIDVYQQLQREVCASSAPTALAAHAARLEKEIDLPYLLEHTPRAVDRAVDGLDRIATIVRSMKEFAHPDQQEMSLVDFNRAVLTTLEVARNEYKYVADITTELGDLPPVRCFAGEINQVVLNLVINAAHAIAHDDAAHVTKGRITIRTRVDGSDVVLEVADTGCGIPEEIRGRIFDPFFTTKEVGRGTGQGLAISRAIVVDKHRGSLQVSSEVGVGTTFTVTLPLAQEPLRMERAA
jgi:PAS domain S-box-containing protein